MSIAEMNVEHTVANFECPDEYKGRLFLVPEDIRKMMGIGESLMYSYLKQAPFRTEKVGTKIFINAKSFWDWYYTGICN